MIKIAKSNEEFWCQHLLASFYFGWTTGVGVCGGLGFEGAEETVQELTEEDILACLAFAADKEAGREMADAKP